MAWWDEIEQGLGTAGAALRNGVDLLAAPFHDPPAPPPLPSSQDPNYDYSGDPTVNNGAPLAPPTYAMSGGGSSSTGSPITTSDSNGTHEANISKIMSIYGYDRAKAEQLLALAVRDSTIQKSLASIGVEPYATQYAPKDSSGSGGSGGAGRVLYPEEVAQLKAETDRILAQTGIYQGQARQINALFDPNYPDGALITLPDGTQRINGTEIIIDSRVRGDFKPVSNAPGYFVDPVTGNVIDTNGNQIAREQLQETIRSNQAQETLQNNRLALDTELGITGLNQNAAITENEQKLKSALETNRLNLDAFSSEGNLNIGATNAETGRLNALTGRTSAAGELSLNKQQLDDARVARVIELASNPQNFVQREYETRALQAPAGIDSPAYRENAAANQAIAQLLTVPNVDSLLPTYTAPRFTEPTLPNSSIPRATAPTYQTPPPVSGASSTPSAPSSMPAPVNNTPATTQQASDHFRAAGVPDWALTPLGFAEGTEGTKERQFIAGDPQQDGQVNPEIVQIHNPAPDTTASVTPIKDMMTMPGEHMMPDGQTMPNDQMAEGQGMDIQALVDSIVQEVLERLQMGGQDDSPDESDLMPGYAYGTDWNNWQPNQSNTNQQLASNLMPELNSSLASTSVPVTNRSVQSRPPQIQQANNRQNFVPDPSTQPMPNQQTQPQINWQNIITKIQQNLQNRFGSNPQVMDWVNQRFPNNNQASIQPVPNNQPPNNPWNIDLSRFNLPRFANGTATDWVTPWRNYQENLARTSSTAAPVNNNSVQSSGRFGPKDSQGNYLGKITSNTDQSIQNMPNVRYAQNYGNQTGYNQLGTGNVGAAFGVNLPDVGGLNLRQLNDIQLDPDAWGTLASLYSSGNRNLQAIYNRVLANAPRGNAVPYGSMIRT